MKDIEKLLDLPMPCLEKRVRTLVNLTKENYPHRDNNMLFLIMYDIESNKVRRLVVKYLQDNGCHRIQKSIFLGNKPAAVFESIRCDLTEIQGMYENEDSIMLIPIQKDSLAASNLIGKNFSIELIAETKNTLFF